MFETRHLFPILDEKLISLLRSLTPDEWEKPTVAKLWTVKDVAAHLLDGNMRMLSFSRDKHILVPDSPVNSYADLVNYLNQFNADWVKAAKRMSPAVLTDLLESTGKEYNAHINTLDPLETALFSVAWAGEQTSLNWFHIAREFTEKWHHQQQIRKATYRPGIMTSELFYPFIHTLLLGLPHMYQNINAPINTAIQITIRSDFGGIWFLVKKDQRWKLSTKNTNSIAAALAIEPDHAWQLFTKALKPEEVLPFVQITGDYTLASTALNMIAVMA